MDIYQKKIIYVYHKDWINDICIDKNELIKNEIKTNNFFINNHFLKITWNNNVVDYFLSFDEVNYYQYVQDYYSIFFNHYSLYYSSENNNVIDLIKSGSADLQKKLEELGFSASVNSSVKEKTDMEMEDSTDQALKEVSTLLVDIKT